MAKTTYHSLVVGVLVWRPVALETRLLRTLDLLPVTSATSDRTRTFLCVRVPLLDLPSPLDLQALCLSSPAATSGVVVGPVLVSYLPTALSSPELSSFSVP